jgi:hypothetical protein
MKAAVGRCEGRKPYGERDGEVAIIERMRALRSAGARWRGYTVNGILGDTRN